MKIVVLDGYTLNPGDLTWDSLKALGECEIHDRTLPGDVVGRGRGAQALLTNKTLISHEHLQLLPEVNYIGVLATGFNVVDLKAAREQGVVVTNVPAYSTPSVAQLTFALLLELTHHAGHHSQAVRQGKWTQSADFAFWDYPLVELHGLTLGLVGFGQIGQAVARIAKAFGMEVCVYTPRPKPGFAGVQFLSLEELLRTSDVVSLHCPLTPETQHLINAERLSWMKPSALLLNTGRGALVHEAALAEALNAGRIGGAGLDVLSTEPPPASNPLLNARGCIITPHLAWASAASRRRLMTTAIENLRAFLAGSPRNVVNAA